MSGYYDGLYGQKRWAPTAMISWNRTGQIVINSTSNGLSYSIVANRGQMCLPLTDTSNWALITRRRYNNAMPISWRL